MKNIRVIFEDVVMYFETMEEASKVAEALNELVYFDVVEDAA